jgi:RNA polymerase sigma-70 factor (family 1)
MSPSDSTLEDGTLVQSLKFGDGKAFEAIYDRYADLLFNYVLRRVRVREDSMEIVQDIFEWLWANRETLEITTSLRNYLYGACKHRVFNYIRSSRIQEKYIQHFTHFVAGRMDYSTEEIIDLSDLQHSIEQSISQLPDKCQTAFRMSRMEHESIQQIAERMNISTRTVENYISQALKHLRASLGEILILMLTFGWLRL